VDWDRLDDVFAGVRRTASTSGQGCNETLQLNGKVLSSFIADYDCYENVKVFFVDDII
jgi:hypothetical protein